MSSQKVVMILLALHLSGCEFLETGAENNSALPANKQQSKFFYPVTDQKTIEARKNYTYVPVYSNIFVSGGGKLNMAITLTIRNTDFQLPITIHAVNYYSTAGELIEGYLEQPYLLEAMASTHFFVTQADLRGGVGANFIVTWSQPDASNVPVIEAVMAGSKGTHGISFIASGVRINGPR